MTLSSKDSLLHLRHILGKITNISKNVHNCSIITISFSATDKDNCQNIMERQHGIPFYSWFSFFDICVHVNHIKR